MGGPTAIEQLLALELAGETAKKAKKNKKKRPKNKAKNVEPQDSPSPLEDGRTPCSTPIPVDPVANQPEWNHPVASPADERCNNVGPRNGTPAIPITANRRYDIDHEKEMRLLASMGWRQEQHGDDGVSEKRKNSMLTKEEIQQFKVSPARPPCLRPRVARH